MSNNTAAIFIPARMDSARFPQKIIYEINGKPLIIHVLERAMKLNISECYVACCCEEIKEIVEKYGGHAILTDPDLPSGTDRVVAALDTLREKPEIVINLQGDNPIFEESSIRKLIDVMMSDETIDISTPVVLNATPGDGRNENLVKTVFNNMEKNAPGRALYFSRTVIPHEAAFFYGHIGIYAYRYAAIKKFVSLPPSFLEKTERLEQLRALQHGMNVWAVPVQGTFISVDVKEDVKKVLEYLAH
ncbi:MAG: 3-deoxy-manno-octulosonate cytidylyltransferase [Holosporales bacterium]|jgi:3-deoxy-manno-octulosonate cytidylyltransferase (CMP-KDO synthetase)|nr:3-deoxy-manno-octulosonate cytidylyltransferase [Holosporales bacterium]